MTTAEKIRADADSIASRVGYLSEWMDEADTLRRQVLMDIADGVCDDPADCAKEALRTYDFVTQE